MRIIDNYRERYYIDECTCITTLAVLARDIGSLKEGNICDLLVEDYVYQKVLLYYLGTVHVISMEDL